VKSLLPLVFSLIAASAAQAAADEQEETLDSIVVTATRTPTLIRDEPLRIEALPAEEIEENLTVQPGNLSTLLVELPGVRMETTAASLGGVGLQLRGMPARHTLVLTDGLPLLGATPSAFGLLQTPPLDLARVEVIKGTASALYGESALGGVLNLVSNTADSEPTVLANANSRGGRDLLGFLSAKSQAAWSGTLTAGVHDQSRQDIDGDGWADLAAYRRYSLRPRVWWNQPSGNSLLLSMGYMDETRRGGTLPGRVTPAGSAFAEVLHTRRLDGGAVGHWLLEGGTRLDTRASWTRTQSDREFGLQRVASTLASAYGEVAWSGNLAQHLWVLGVAFEHNALSAAPVAGINYRYNIPAMFAQDEVALSPWLTIAASARVDSVNRYGSFLSARLSALWHQPRGDWSVRASIGNGFAAPTPFVEAVEATSLSALLPLHDLHAERAVTASLDAKWADRGWDVNASVFAGEIRGALDARSIADHRLDIFNQPGPRRVRGIEGLIRYVAGPLQTIASWSAMIATESTTPGSCNDVPHIPRRSAELAAILGSEKHGRVGLELSYTGRQALADNPFRSEGPAYIEINALGEIRFGNLGIFLNAINLTDRRQTRIDPLLRPSLGPGGDPITDGWAPLDGRTFNLGVRIEL
jgi:outer membrane receptor for ferrienterochelin and colicins